MKRRLLLAGLALPLPGLALAQGGWPQRPVRLVSPFAAGSTVDLMARAVAQPLGEALGQPVVVENRTGAGGNVGVDAAAKAPKDGYTLAIGTSGPLSINPELLPAMPYDVAAELAPVSLLAIGPNVLLLGKDVPAQSVPELVALARARPGALNYGSSGIGSSNHLAGAVFAATAGVELTHIPYRGNADMVNDLVAGRLHMVFSGLPPVLPLVQAGTLRPLVVSGPARVAAIAQVPTVAEVGLAGAEAISFYGVVAPSGTPGAVLERLGAALRQVLAREDVRRIFAGLGSEAAASTPAEFSALIASERAKWGAVIRRYGIRPG